MRRFFPTVSHRGFGSVLGAVAVLGLLMMPVEYRAGAHHPHPHAAFQLWADFTPGTVPHRHDEGGDAATTLIRGDHGGVAGTDAVWATAPPDVPLLSEVAPALDRAAAVAAVMALVGLLVAAALPRVVGLARRWAGLLLRPDPPPPRIATACS